MCFHSEYHLVKYDGKTRICPVFCCTSCVKNMERNITRETIHTELGWESLNLRWWSRRLTLFHKFMNDLTPAYTINPIPPFQQSQYSLRNQDVVGRIGARTEKFQSAFYPHCLSEWNKLDPEVRTAPSVAVFSQSCNPKYALLQNPCLVFMTQKDYPTLLN